MCACQRWLACKPYLQHPFRLRLHAQRMEAQGLEHISTTEVELPMRCIYKLRTHAGCPIRDSSDEILHCSQQLLRYELMNCVCKSRPNPQVCYPNQYEFRGLATAIVCELAWIGRYRKTTARWALFVLVFRQQYCFVCVIPSKTPGFWKLECHNIYS